MKNGGRQATWVLAIGLTAGVLQAAEIHEAAGRGDIAAVRRIVAADPAQVESKSDDQAAQTALTIAAWEGRVDVVRFLLDRGADSTARNAWGRTPLHNAATRGHRAVAELLLDAGANIEVRSDDGATPLFDACIRSQPKVAFLLLDRGARVNTRTDHDQTPLHGALGVFGQDLALIRRLLDLGAEVNAQGNRGDTPLSWAIARGNVEAATLLVERGANLSSSSHPDGSLLSKAIKEGQRELARLLVERGAMVNRTDPHGFYELHWAAIRGDSGIVGPLLEHGARVDALDSHNRTPLYYAARHGHRAVADALIRAGAGANSVEEQNFGLAPQLRQPLADGEAFLWYLGGHAGDGWAVKTRRHLLLFNAVGFSTDPEAGLADGRLNPRELSGLDLRVFVSKPEGDHFPLDVLEPPTELGNLWSVVPFAPSANDATVDPEGARRIAAGEELRLDGLRVRAIEATLGGLAYLIDVDGLRIYYGGYHVANSPRDRDRFRAGIAALNVDGTPVDIAFLPVAGHLVRANSYEEYPYLIRELRPRSVYLMHGNYGREAYWECRTRLSSVPDVSIEHPRSEGDRFHFVRSGVNRVTSSALDPDPGAR